MVLVLGRGTITLREPLEHWSGRHRLNYSFINTDDYMNIVLKLH